MKGLWQSLPVEIDKKPYSQFSLDPLRASHVEKLLVAVISQPVFLISHSN